MSDWDEMLDENDELRDKWEALVEEYADAALDEMEEKTRADLEARYLSAITGPVSPEAVANAKALAKTAAHTLVRDMAKEQLASMGATIAQALADGKRPKDIARQLREVTMLDGPRQRRLDKISEDLKAQGLTGKAYDDALAKAKQALIRERQETIARTEGAKAVNAARNEEAKSRGAKWKGWTTGHDERLCPVCAGNEAAGVIPIDAPFPSGVQHSPAHPRCRCTVFYVTSDAAKKVADERQKERAAETEAMRTAAKEKA